MEINKIILKGLTEITRSIKLENEAFSQQDIYDLISMQIEILRNKMKNTSKLNSFVNEFTKEQRIEMIEMGLSFFNKEDCLIYKEYFEQKNHVNKDELLNFKNKYSRTLLERIELLKKQQYPLYSNCGCQDEKEESIIESDTLDEENKKIILEALSKKEEEISKFEKQRNIDKKQWEKDLNEKLNDFIEKKEADYEAFRKYQSTQRNSK